MKNKFIKEVLGWGVVLWLVGYVLGIVLFMILPLSMIGWVIMPVGISVTLWVLFKKIDRSPFGYYLVLGTIWTVVAIVLDYFLLVKLFKPADGYYKLDVYLYYLFTFFLPIATFFKNKINRQTGKG